MGHITGRDRVLLVVLLACFVVAGSSVQWQRFDLFLAADHDLAMMVQRYWRAVNAGDLTETILGWPFWRIHFSPVLVVPAALYAVSGDFRAVLCLQVLCLALGAVPLWQLARARLQHPALAWAVTAAYLLATPVVRLAVTDSYFESVVLLPIWLAVLSARARGCWNACFLWLAVALLCKEEVCIMAAAFGLFIAVHDGKRRAGLLLAAFSAIFFITVTGAVLPRWGMPGDPLGFLYAGEGSLFGNAGAGLGTALLAGVSRFPSWLLAMALPLALLPLLAPEIFLIAVPVLAYHLAGPPWLMHPYNYYQALLIPFFFAAAIDGAARLCRWLHLQSRGRVLLGMAVVLAAAGDHLWHLPYACDGDVPAAAARMPALRAAVQLVPPVGSVMATENILAHLAERLTIHLPHYTGVREDWIILDLQHRAGAWPDYERVLAGLLTELQRQVAAGVYVVRLCRDDVLVLQREGGVPAPENAAAFRETAARQLTLLPAPPVAGSGLLGPASPYDEELVYGDITAAPYPLVVARARHGVPLTRPSAATVRRP